jgi:DNA-binding PadR family transcriptional regulator
MAAQGTTTHWHQAINILAKRGAGFIRIKRGSKLPKDLAWNQTANTLDAKEAKKNLAGGYNIGLAAGSGNLYAFDFDRDAERGHECAQIAGGMYFFRKTALDKAKFVFQCDTPIPYRCRSEKHGIDLLALYANGTHSNCVFAGIHASGAAIEWGGHTIPVLPAETVAALWEEWTGEELFAAEREERQPDATYISADLARVADALGYVDPNDMDYNTWIGIIAAIHDAFDGSDDALDVAVNWADGKANEVERKWPTFDREYTGAPATLDGLFYRARRGGWPDTWLHERLAEYRVWLAGHDAIEALKAAGFRNAEQARKLLDTILQQCEERKSLRITPGYAYLQKKSTIALGGLGRYLSRLFAAGLVNLRLGEKGGNATVIELVFANVNSYTPDGETIHISKNWNIYREQRDSEAFINSHHAYSSTRTQATLPTLGANGLGALLALLDGPASIREAAEVVNYTYGVMAQALRRYVAHGLVNVSTGGRNRKIYSLKAEWRDILKANIPKLPTYAVQLVRHVDALKSRVKILDHKGETEKAEKVDAEYKRMAALLAKVKEAAGIIPFVRPPRVDKDAERLDRLRHATRIGEQAEQRPKRRGYKPKRPEVSIFAADAEWDSLNAWAQVEYGFGWWIRRDVNGILAAYERYLAAQDFVPTMHWAGEMAVAA